MNCPFCTSNLSSVLDKRAVKSSGEIRRRRKCLKCSRRYTTYERISEIEFIVIKRDGRRQAFDSDKLRAGLQRALEKRPGQAQIETIVSRIEKKIKGKNQKEIQSSQIGQAVLQELKKVDTVAYLRFASVYRDFGKVEDFTKELESLKIKTI